MKKIKHIFALFIICLFITNTINAQSPNYKHGTVWSVGFIKTKANMEVEYLNSIKNTWKAVCDEAVKQGLIVSYKILEGSYSNQSDWNIMLMREYKDYNSMGDVNIEKWEAIQKSVIGSEDKMKATNEGRVNIREIFGDKVLTEVIYK